MNALIHPRSEALKAAAKKLVLAALGIACFLMMGLNAKADSGVVCKDVNEPHEDCGIHNMMVVGQKSVFLSHLPMFHSEHRFQLILEASFRKNDKNLDGIYLKDRKSHPKTKMYTLSPREAFVLSTMFGADDQASLRKAFSGTVFRGHLEREGSAAINGLTGVSVDVTRVVYAREIQPDDRKSDELEYILFGKDQEFFLAHRITQAPDFDHIVGAKISGRDFTPAELRVGITVKVPNRENSAAQRLKSKETVAGQGHVTGADQSLPLQINVGTEYYFEEGELSSPANFEQTPLEKKAGF